MNRQNKENVIQDLSQKFSNSQAAFVVKCQGLSVGQLHELRMKLEVKDGQLKVAKNRLVKLAIANNGKCLDLGPSMVGQTAVVFAQQDFTGVAKVLHDFSRANEELVIVAGYCESQLFDKQGVVSLAKIPSREVLLSRLCGVLKAPIVKMAWIVGQVSAQKSGGVSAQQVAAD